MGGMSWDDKQVTVVNYGSPVFVEVQVVDGVPHCREFCVWCGGGPMVLVDGDRWMCPVGARVMEAFSAASKRLDAAIFGTDLSGDIDRT